MRKQSQRKYPRLDTIFEIQKLNEKDISKIFYLSLFDPDQFIQPDFYDNPQQIREKIEKVLRDFGKDYIKRDKLLESIIDSQFFDGKVTNLIMSDKLGQIFKTTVLPSSTVIKEKEIDVYIPSKKLSLEIKRIFSTGNLGSYLEDQIRKYKIITKNEVENILIVFIIHTKNEEQNSIIKRLVDGYRSLFDILQKRKIVPRRFHFYVIGFSENGDINDFLKGLIERINKIYIG